MTRIEFIDSINDFFSLKDFCSECGYDICDDIYDDESRDDEIEYGISEYYDEYSWRDLRDCLYDIPTGYEFYRKDGTFDWYPLDNEDFLRYKDDVYNWAIDHGYIDDDDEDEEDSDEDDIFASEPDIAEEEPVVEEDFSIGELMGMSAVMLITLHNADMERKCKADEEFAEFVLQNVPKALT